MNDKNYWEWYYKKHSKPWKESPFASFVWDYIESWKTIFELGCWNARDSIFFNENWLNVFAIDQCDNEIALLKENYWNDKLSFSSWDFTRMRVENNYDYIYSRFTLHSIDSESEVRTLKWIYDSLVDGWNFFLEARSINDPLCWEWDEVSDNWYVTDHYRRFLNYEDFIIRLEKMWFNIDYKIESNGLAVHKDEDPVVIRIIAKK